MIKSRQLIRQLNFKRFVSEATIVEQANLGEEMTVSDTGFILKRKDATTLFFDRVCPPKTSKWDVKQYINPIFFPVKSDAIKDYIKSITGSHELIDITPIPRDGGAFVTFKMPSATTPQLYNKSLIYTIGEKISKTHRLLKPAIYPVKGIPWIEDLGRYPSTTLKVIFNGSDLSQESLYALFRRYGKIADIALPAAADPIPRAAVITFWNMRSAIAAKQCLTGTEIGDTTIHIHYKKKISEHWLPNFITNHSRIAIPLILALIAGFAVVIFDPIRSWFMKEKITGEFSLNRIYLWKELWSGWVSTREKVKGLLNMNADENNEWELWSEIEDLMEERSEKAKDVKIWLDENVNSMIVIQGPAGSGKRNLVENMVLEGRDNVLYVDCENIIKSRKDYQLIQSFANEIGYFPVFSWLSSISSFIDLFVKSLTGQNSGLTESKEVQIANMLTLSVGSVRDIALRDYYKMISSNDQFHMKEEDYLQQNPQVKPVIVIDRFQAARKATQNNSFIYQALAEWASTLIQLNVAHVIFITDDVGSIQKLITSLPNSPLKRVILSDASETASNVYVSQALKMEKGEAPKDELFKYTKLLGGRMRDLQMYVRRIRSGDNPEQAFEGLTQQAIEQLAQVFLISDSDYGFNSSQVWQIIKMLSDKESIKYEDVFLLPMFKANTFKILQSMENVELLKLVRQEGVIVEIKPAKPLFSIAFEQMVSDPNIYKAMEKECLLGKIAFETNRIRGFEDELTKFKECSEPKLFKERLHYLSNKIETGSKTITQCETDMVKLPK